MLMRKLPMVAAVVAASLFWVSSARADEWSGGGRDIAPVESVVPAGNVAARASTMTPEATIGRFIGAINRGDVDEAARYVWYGQTGVVLTYLEADLKKNPVSFDVDSLKCVTIGNRAWVDVTGEVTFKGDSDEFNEHLPLVRHGGAWLIEPSSPRALFSPYIATEDYMLRIATAAAFPDAARRCGSVLDTSSPPISAGVDQPSRILPHRRNQN